MGGGSNSEHLAKHAASRGSGGKATAFGLCAMSTPACEPMEQRSAVALTYPSICVSGRQEEELTVHPAVSVHMDIAALGCNMSDGS